MTDHYRIKFHRLGFEPTYRELLSHLLLTTLLVLQLHTAYADDRPDYDREARIVQEIEPHIFDGEAVWLDTSERPFLSIYLQADKPRGAVLILHGRDTHPEDANVAGPMRVGLVDAEWSTLALQMPVLAKGKKYYDYLPILKFAHARIRAGLEFLRSQGYQTVVLAGHSCGAHMANDWLNHYGDRSIDGYIAVGLGVTDFGQDLKTPFPIDTMAVPVLDIYGSEEYPRPLAMVPLRAKMLEMNGHPGSKQMVVEGAGHFFRDHGDPLTEMVAGWLNRLSF